MGKLTNKEFQAALAKPGTYGDGDGLFLKVSRTGGVSWLLRVQHDGKRRDIGLGSAKLVTLAAARAKAAEARKATREDGRDLVAEKRKAKAESVTFRDAALTYYETHKNQWSNAKSDEQWINSITAGEIITTIAKVWAEKPETGRRVKQRIRAVLNFAHTRGWRSTEAPTDALAAGNGLPKQKGGKHHAAMPYANIPAFITRLRTAGGTWGRLALEFVILTAARSQEVRLAAWSEIDLEKRLWTVPADHMKMRIEHVVPLSPHALTVLHSAMAIRREGTDMIFPGMIGGAMSDMTLLETVMNLRRARRPVSS